MSKISAIISEATHKFGIDYHSKYLKKEIENNNIVKLSEVYVNLKIMIGTLSEIEEHYPDLMIKHFFEKIIRKLQIIDHKIITEAIELSKKKKEKM